MEEQRSDDLAQARNERPAECSAPVARAKARHIDALAIQARDTRIIALTERAIKAEQTIAEWVAANGPGGWIDELRLAAQRARNLAVLSHREAETAEEQQSELTKQNDLRWISAIAYAAHKAGIYNATAPVDAARALLLLNDLAAAAVASEVSLAALAIIRRAGNCENYTSGIGSCFRNGRTPDSEYGAYRACDACIADAAIERATASDARSMTLLRSATK